MMKIKTSISIMTIISIISSIIMCFPLNASGADDIIIEVPDEVEYGEVEYFNEEDDETEATVSIENGKAIVSGTEKNGYYTVYFFSSEDVTIGISEFFRNSSGMICDPYNEDESGYNPVYEEFEEEPEDEEGELIPDISGDMSVKVTGIPESAVKAEISFFADNGNYGDMEQKLNITDGTVTFGLGYAGEYSVSFCDIDDNLLGSADFLLDENGIISIYVEEDLIETNEVYFIEYEEESEEGNNIPDISGNLNVKITGIPENAIKADISLFTENDDYGEMEQELNITDGTVTLGLGYAGEYSVSFYDINDNLLGSADFLLDENGTIKVYDGEQLTEKNEVPFVEYVEEYDPDEESPTEPTTTTEITTTTVVTTTTTEETTTTTAETTTTTEETTTTTAETTTTTEKTTTTTVETTTTPVVSTTVTSNDLPQTGNNAPNKFFITISAIMFAVSGAYVMMKSGIIRIKSK